MLNSACHNRPAVGLHAPFTFAGARGRKAARFHDNKKARRTMTAHLPFYSGMSDLAPDYDGFVLDLWGVIHDGITLYPGVVDCLQRLHAAGKKFVMLSNAPRRGAAIARSMQDMGMPEEFCRDIMSSGEATYLCLRDRDDPWLADIGRRCLHIGPARDLSLFEGLDIERVERAEDAEFIVNTGPWEDGETVADYETMLAAGAARGLKMVCANPDLEVIRGGRRIICAGALAERYEELGGAVFYLGKPRPAIYDTCFRMLDIAARDRILAIGDSIRTDIAGARACGIDSILVVGGLHGEELLDSAGAPDADGINQACARADCFPGGVITTFRW